MADKTIRCKVITPEDRILDAAVLYASVPMWDGQRGVMHRTGAIVGKLGYGELRLDMPQGEDLRWFIDGGFMQNVNDELTILAGGALPVEDIDEGEARAELAEAEARKATDAMDMERINQDRQRARAKLALARSR